MSVMIALLNDLSYIPPNNKQNEPTRGDIGETSNEPTQAKHSEFKELYASANEELYPSCDYVTRLDFMAKFTYFKSSHTAKEMTWHATEKCTEPGKMQHPVDGRAWKNFNPKYPNFAKEPRNVRLRLAADGFNLFGNLSQAYSMWPVILTTYNLPPWLCIKESSFMLTLLIPGPKSLGKDIDVLLEALIDDLKGLINDFPARSSLSGWSGQEPPEKRKKFCQFIKGVKLPDEFRSNFKHKVTDNDTNITGLKSHDCHIMMQRLLPYGLQQYLPDEVFRSLCKSIGLRSVIRIDAQELKKVTCKFPNKDIKEEFPDWFGSQMSADVARGHGDDDGGDDRPPTNHIPIGCGGYFVNRGKVDKNTAKNNQSQVWNGKDKVKSKSIVNQVKEIQLKGLKLPNLKLYYKS
ncbi:retrotransposon gag domain, retroviral aspartyl protease [Tanacetum coccineum]|uniref:Retrotransposon gag domain, retroviral aspartyl protease n=1 Tax=Tanacetum coccineum TaxID=301880 RepID=A0ABQ5G8B0_9ASTR